MCVAGTDATPKQPIAIARLATMRRKTVRLEPGEGAPCAAAGEPMGDSDLVMLILGFGATTFGFGRAFRCTFFGFGCGCTRGFVVATGAEVVGRYAGAGLDDGRGAGDTGLGRGFGCGFGVSFGFGGAGSGAGSVTAGTVVVGGDGSSAQAGEAPPAATAATSTNSQAASTRPRRATFPPPRYKTAARIVSRVPGGLQGGLHWPAWLQGARS